MITTNQLHGTMAAYTTAVRRRKFIHLRKRGPELQDIIYHQDILISAKIIFKNYFLE